MQNRDRSFRSQCGAVRVIHQDHVGGLGLRPFAELLHGPGIRGSHRLVFEREEEHRGGVAEFPHDLRVVLEAVFKPDRVVVIAFAVDVGRREKLPPGSFAFTHDSRIVTGGDRPVLQIETVIAQEVDVSLPPGDFDASRLVARALPQPLMGLVIAAERPMMEKLIRCEFERRVPTKAQCSGSRQMTAPVFVSPNRISSVSFISARALPSGRQCSTESGKVDPESCRFPPEINTASAKAPPLRRRLSAAPRRRNSAKRSSPLPAPSGPSRTPASRSSARCVSAG